MKGRITRSKDNKLETLHVRRNKLAEVKEALSIISVEGNETIVKFILNHLVNRCRKSKTLDHPTYSLIAKTETPRFIGQ